MGVDIRIGLQNSPREIAFESEQDAAEIEQALSAARSSNGVLRLSDRKGSVYLVPADAIAYLEIGTEEARRVGFVG